MIFIDIVIIAALVLLLIAGILIAFDKVPAPLVPIVRAPLRAWRWIAVVVIARVALLYHSRSSAGSAEQAVDEFEEQTDKVLKIERDAAAEVLVADKEFEIRLKQIQDRRARRAAENARASEAEADLLARFDAETEEAIR